MKKLLSLVLALALVLSLAACGGKTDPAPAAPAAPAEQPADPGTSEPEETPEPAPDDDKVPETPADFLAKFGLTEADVKTADAGDGVLTLNPSDSNYGQVVYDGTESLKDPAVREGYFNQMLEKCRSLATDGEVYSNVSTKEVFAFPENFFEGTFNSATWQYNYEDGYVTFSVDNISGSLKITLWK